ncbi:MAG: DsbE family thiol:disulfide interchange protein, partial [Methylocystis sp.]
GVDPAGRTAIDFGVYGVPETFVIKGDGTIAYKFVGPLTPSAIATTLIPEIEKAMGGGAATTR